MRIALALTATALTLTAAASTAVACAPPPPPWVLGKTLPVDGATGVPVNSAILLFPEQGLSSEAIDQRVGASCTVQPAGDEERIPDWEDRADFWRDGFRFQPPAALSPDTEYAVRCAIYGFNDDAYHRWTFRTAPAAAALPLSSRFIGANPFNAVRKETRCEWVGGGCGSSPDCQPIEALHEHAEVETRLAVDAGDWPEVMVFVGSGDTAEAALGRARWAAHPTVVPSGELDVAADAGRAHENATGELCTAVVIESFAGEVQALDAHCVDAPPPETAPPAPEAAGPASEPAGDPQLSANAEAGGCSASPAPTSTGAAWALLLLLSGLRRRRRLS